jgi:prevent-host-death family protein
MQSWPIHEAKARLSELVKRAQQQPQQLTSHGEPVAFIRRSPLVGVDDLDLERSSDFTRDREL